MFGILDKARVGYAIAMIVATALVLALLYPIWQPLLLAVIIAAVLHGPKERLAHRLKDRPALATGMVLTGVTLLLIIPLAVLLTIAISQTVSAVSFIRGALEKGGVNQLVDKLPEQVENAAKWLLKMVPGGLRGLMDKIGGGAQVADWAGAFFSTISEAIFQVTIVLIALYFLLLEGRQLVEWFVERSPIGVTRTKQLLSTYRRASRAVLASTVITAAAQSAVAGVGYLIAQVPQPLFFTMLTFFTAFVPSVGTAIVAIPVCGLLWATGHLGWAIFLAIWSMAVVATVDNLLKPILMGDGMKVNGALVFFALVGGVIMFGPIGLVLGPLGLTFFFSIVALGEELAPEQQTPAGIVLVSSTGSGPVAPLPLDPGLPNEDDKAEPPTPSSETAPERDKE